MDTYSDDGGGAANGDWQCPGKCVGDRAVYWESRRKKVGVDCWGGEGTTNKRVLEFIYCSSAGHTVSCVRS